MVEPFFCRTTGSGDDNFLRMESVMNRIVSVLVCGIFSLFLASSAFAKEIKTENFVFNVPDSWEHTTAQSQGVDMVLLQEKASNTVMTITLTPVAMSAKDFATQSAAAMKNGGLTVSELSPIGNAYMLTIEKQGMTGVTYMASNGKAASAIMVLSPAPASIEKAKDLLKKGFKPLDPELYPSTF